MLYNYPLLLFVKVLFHRFIISSSYKVEVRKLEKHIISYIQITMKLSNVHSCL